MKLAVALRTLALMLPLSAIAALSNRDAGYLRAEMQNQLGRYALATLAEKRASTAQLKQLAASMATEATAHTRALDKIAKRNGIPVPAHPSVRSSYHYSQLAGLQGKAFDRRFVQLLGVDDRIARSNEQAEMSGGSDAALRALAEHHDRTLQNELRALHNIPH